MEENSRLQQNIRSTSDQQSVVCIYSDTIARVLRHFCDLEVRRASHVDTFLDLLPEIQKRIPEEKIDPFSWWVDFSPIEGKEGTILGPFLSRGDALEAEVIYLKKKLNDKTLQE